MTATTTPYAAHFRPARRGRAALRSWLEPAAGLEPPQDPLPPEDVLSPEARPVGMLQ